MSKKKTEVDSFHPLAIYMYKDQVKKINDICKERQITRAVFMRHVIDAAIEHYEKTGRII